jgi:hypothetical protein
MSFGAARWIQPLLFDETPMDPVIFGAVAVLIATAALLASAGPAIRATRADPNAARRVD